MLTARSSRSNRSCWSARRTASSDAARTVERGSCTLAGGEFSGCRLFSSWNPASPLVSASGVVVPSIAVKHRVQSPCIASGACCGFVVPPSNAGARAPGSRIAFPLFL